MRERDRKWLTAKRRRDGLAAVVADLTRQGFLPAKRKLEADKRAEGRRIALRFLRRGIRKGDAMAAADRKRKPGSLGHYHRAGVWFVVVAASHKSGKFQG